MRLVRFISAIGLLCISLCSTSVRAKPRVVHVLVALADNQHQGIIAVPSALGNGEDPPTQFVLGRSIWS